MAVETDFAYGSHRLARRLHDSASHQGAVPDFRAAISNRLRSASRSCCLPPPSRLPAIIVGRLALLAAGFIATSFVHGAKDMDGNDGEEQIGRSGSGLLLGPLVGGLHPGVR